MRKQLTMIAILLYIHDGMNGVSKVPGTYTNGKMLRIKPLWKVVTSKSSSLSIRVGSNYAYTKFDREHAMHAKRILGVRRSLV